MSNRKIEYFNLDVIISVGYQVKSSAGVVFRKWANKILKDYLIKGYSVNEKRLDILNKTIEIQSKMLANSLEIELQELHHVIQAYDQALSLLDDYDHQIISKPIGSKDLHILSYSKCRRLINDMPFYGRSNVFGVEKEKGKLEGILAAIYQNVFGKEVYPTLEEKAANLLYFLIKDHPFADGCKRIAACIFLQFLYLNNHLYINNRKK